MRPSLRSGVSPYLHGYLLVWPFGCRWPEVTWFAPLFRDGSYDMFSISRDWAWPTVSERFI